MLGSLESSLSLDGLLKLLTALILFSVLVALLQSDATAGAVRRAAFNILALPLLLTADLISGVEMTLASDRTKNIFSVIQNSFFRALEVVAASISLAMRHAGAICKTRSTLLAAQRMMLESLDTVCFFAGRVKHTFAISQALGSIALDASIEYIRTARAGRSLSTDALYICIFILRSVIGLTSLLWTSSKLLGSFLNVTAVLIHRRLKTSPNYISFLSFLILNWGFLKAVAHKMHMPYDEVSKKLAQNVQSALEFVFGDGLAIERNSIDLTTQCPASGSSLLSASGPSAVCQSPWKGRLRTRTSSGRDAKL